MSQTKRVLSGLAAGIIVGILLAWLDADKNPLFILLPASEYARLQKSWQLPERNP